MAEQLTFDLPVSTAFGRDDFFVSPANSLVVEVVERWLLWPQGKLVLVGPEGSGKSHLATIWAELSGAKMVSATDLNSEDVTVLGDHPICVENVHSISGNLSAQEMLFHLHNSMAHSERPFLMTGQGDVSSWNIDLHDLKSRLLGSHTHVLSAPDDSLLSAVMVKQFADRQLRIEPGVVTYILSRMNRSFKDAKLLVNALDKESLRLRAPIGKQMARRVMEVLEQDTD